MFKSSSLTRWLNVNVTLFGFLFLSILAQASVETIFEVQKRLQQKKIGEKLFQQRCVGCHGVKGDGAGKLVGMLDPKPRNLVESSYRFRSTASGTLPTDADLMRTLEQGVLGTSMPTFHFLSTEKKKALILYIKSLRDWDIDLTEVVAIPPTPADIFSSKVKLFSEGKKGQTLFAENCATCHGNTGLGDGEGAEDLETEEEHAIKPANLQKKFVKSGATASDLFRAISTGLDGTPMAGFADAFTVEERWQLVAFIFQLRGIGSGKYSTAEVFVSSAKESK